MLCIKTLNIRIETKDYGQSYKWIINDLKYTNRIKGGIIAEFWNRVRKDEEKVWAI